MITILPLAKIKSIFSNLSFKTKLILLVAIISAAAIPGGYFLHNSITGKSEWEIIGVSEDNSKNGEVAGESITESGNPIPTGDKTGANTKSPTPSPSASSSTNPSNKPQSPAPTSSNYVSYQNPSPSTQPTNIVIVSPQKISKAECDAKRNSIDSDFYFAVSDSNRRWESEKLAVTRDFGARGIPISSGIVQDAFHLFLLIKL